MQRFTTSLSLRNNGRRDASYFSQRPLQLQQQNFVFRSGVRPLLSSRTASILVHSRFHFVIAWRILQISQFALQIRQPQHQHFLLLNTFVTHSNCDLRTSVSNSSSSSWNSSSSISLDSDILSPISQSSEKFFETLFKDPFEGHGKEERKERKKRKRQEMSMCD